MTIKLSTNLPSVPEAELTQDTGDAVLYGVQADVDLPGDLGVRVTLKDEGEDLLLLRREPGPSEASLTRAAASSSFSTTNSQTRTPACACRCAPGWKT